MIDRKLLNRVAQALDVAQSLLGRSQHHNQILDAYIELRQAIAEPDDPFYCGDIDEEYKAVLAQPERELKALYPEPHTTLHDVCQEVLRLEKINAELLNALQFFAKAEINDDNCASLEVAQRRVRTFAANAIAKTGEQAWPVEIEE